METLIVIGVCFSISVVFAALVIGISRFVTGAPLPFPDYSNAGGMEMDSALDAAQSLLRIANTANDDYWRQKALEQFYVVYYASPLRFSNLPPEMIDDIYAAEEKLYAVEGAPCRDVDGRSYSAPGYDEIKRLSDEEGISRAAAESRLIRQRKGY